MNKHDAKGKSQQVGLVLPGGGARASYQAGSAAFIAEWAHSHGQVVTAIAGSGVGAINAAILAGAPNLREGASRLKEVWNAIATLPSAELKIFRNLPGFGLGTLISVLSSAGETSSVDRLLRQLPRIGVSLPPGKVHPWVADVVAEALQFDSQLKANKDLIRMLENFMHGPFASDRMRLYVSVYESDGALMDLARLALSAVSSIDTKSSRLLEVTSIRPEERHEAILAAAALPMIFDAREVMGIQMGSGEFGGWRSQQGRVPAGQLYEREKSLSKIFVLHASDGSLWDRAGQLLPTTVEVRPSQALGTGNILHDMALADAHTIEQRFKQGYRDAQKSIENVSEVVGAVMDAGAAADERENAVRNFLDSGLKP